MSWVEERTVRDNVLRAPSPCRPPEQGCKRGLTWPHALQVDFQLYDPPAYSADHKDTAVQDPFNL